MQFKYPEILYALFLLIIPIIIHLFQLRKFRKIEFTNVAFLKKSVLQTRKSSQIKKWLVLFTRLFLLATLIFAFAQPYTSKTNHFNTDKETVIYLDNSFSMQAKGPQGELLKRAIQDLITNIPEEDNITIFTNNVLFKNTSIKRIKNDLLKLDYSPKKLTTEAALLKSNTLFKKKSNALKNTILISDFQNNNKKISVKKDSLSNFVFIKLNPVNKNNISIDSVYISKVTPTAIELKTIVKNTGNTIDNLPISLYNNNKLIAKTSSRIDQETTAVFSLPTNQEINGKITVFDTGLAYDNTLYFNINKTSKTNVLSINGKNDSFLKRIYNPTAFNYTSSLIHQLNYNIIEDQHLIILNELDNIPSSLVSTLKQYNNQGNYIIIIPSKSIHNNSYNQLLNSLNGSFNIFKDLVDIKKQVTTINYSHPVYNNGVFEKRVKNFQYPKVNSFYPITSANLSGILAYEDGQIFLGQNKNMYLFTAALNQENSNFKNSPLIVPTLYNIAKQSLKIPQLYYTIGKENTFHIKSKLPQNDILSLVKDKVHIIPKQQYYNNKIVINTFEKPSISGTYQIKNENKTIKNLSYNYNRNESDFTYQNLSLPKNITVSHSIPKAFNAIKSNAEMNTLWKWFAIFALALLIIEMLILKFFK